MNAADSVDLCTDEDLLKLYRGGQADAFGALVRRYERELFGYLRRYLGDQALAEDVFQNTFLQVFLKIEQYDAKRLVRPWLYTIATHQAIDALRRTGRRPTLSLDRLHEAQANGDGHSLLELLQTAPDPDPFERLDAAERQRLVRAAVDELPDHLRSTLILAYFQGLKHKDIAEVLGVPLGTVKSRLHAAVQRLQAAWQRMNPVTEEV